MRVHANDGISAQAVNSLKEDGLKVTTDHVPQDDLAAYMNKENVEVLLVRSATKVRRALIDECPQLKMIGRGGVGMDNIDVAYAKEKGLMVINTPASSSISVAELVMAHVFTLMRDLHKSNRNMPVNGAAKFGEMKKEYGKGAEVRGKVMGVIGFGRIGQWTARYALGNGMKVIYVDSRATAEAIELEVGGNTVRVPVKMVNMDELLAQADVITMHIPAQKDGLAVLSAEELAKVKPGVVIVNTARGGSIDEDALLKALKDGRVRGAALDVFVGEPSPKEELLKEEKLSLTPHIGAATTEAQDRVGDELADQIIAWRASVGVS
ncbi:MAG TPA: NAD(P)-dependent oxidoreductase [Flavobacteriales bacterium]|nr:3-phosphoglycerate dehydrogenase [Flavobacteriales bacterium]HQV75396.1 NAD(P)-dependent oxidoreductase [Flavobacteriales bacterium]HQW41067.1 NAD(P)-dependent oxidoreductase [Flavobacteriales bacterium]